MKPEKGKKKIKLNKMMFCVFSLLCLLISFFLFFFFFFVFFVVVVVIVVFIFWAAPVVYGGSQARGPIGAIATGLRQSHSNAGSEPRLQPTPQLTATLYC